MYKLPVLLLCIFVALILCQIIALISKKRRGGKVSSQKAVIVKIDESITGVYSPVRHRTGDYSMANYKKIVTFRLVDNSTLVLELNAHQAKKLQLNMEGILKTNNTSFVSFTQDTSTR